MTKATTKPAATETTFEITEEDVLARTEAAILALADIFVDNVTTDTEQDGKIVPVTKNRLYYLQNRIVNGIVWKLEAEMLDAHKKVAEHEQILQSYENAEAGIVTQRMRDDKEYWLDAHRETFYLTAIAFERALVLHEAITGKPFKTAAERAAEKAATKNVVTARKPRIGADRASALAQRMGLAG